MNLRQLCISHLQWDQLKEMLFTADLAENFSFGLARPVRRRSGALYVLEDLAPLRRSDYERRSGGGLTITRSASNKLNSIARDAAGAGLVPVHFHSHPPGCCDFSGYDDEHEAKLHDWLRSMNQPLLASVVIPYRGLPTGRLWVEGAAESLCLRRGLQPIGGYVECEHPSLDRQRAFGQGLTTAASNLSVAVIGVGGIGMLAVEQLGRCGFKTFILVDNDRVDRTNLNRLTGAFPSDIGTSKLAVAARLIRQCAGAVETCSDVRVFNEDIYTASERVQTMVRQCDLVLALTDNQLSRIRALRLAMEGYAEYLSAGVDIRLSKGGTIDGLYAEIVGAERKRFCPVCAGRLNPSEAAIEARRYVDNFVAEHAVREGYLPSVPAPAVMSLNSTAAGMLCLEIQRRVSGLGQRDLIQVDWQSGVVRTVDRGDRVLREACAVCGRPGPTKPASHGLSADPGGGMT